MNGLTSACFASMPGTLRVRINNSNEVMQKSLAHVGNVRRIKKVWVHLNAVQVAATAAQPNSVSAGDIAELELAIRPPWGHNVTASIRGNMS